MSSWSFRRPSLLLRARRNLTARLSVNSWYQLQDDDQLSSLHQRLGDWRYQSVATWQPLGTLALIKSLLNFRCLALRCT